MNYYQEMREALESAAFVIVDNCTNKRKITRTC